MRYRPGGYGERYPEFFDLTNLSLPDQSVSLFYCCHVLNALVEDRQAMREVFRVLAPQGVAVLQVPAFCTEATTIEALDSAEQRVAAFHDPLIYRCYTDSDYRARLKAAGFHVESFTAVNYPEAERTRMGLHEEVLHVGFRDSGHPAALALAAMSVERKEAATQ
jgi:SAM-dependent methyltransferase